MTVNKEKTAVKKRFYCMHCPQTTLLKLQTTKRKINEINYPYESDHKYWLKTIFKKQTTIMGSWKISSSKGRKPAELPQLPLCTRSLPSCLWLVIVVVFPEQKPLAWLTCVLKWDGFSCLVQACNPKITLELGMEERQGMDTAPCNIGIEAD